MQRMLHTMLRVGDMQRAIDFYTRILEMKILRTYERPEEKYTLTFLGFGNESETCVLELTYNHGISDYDMGNAFGHIAIGVDDCQAACSKVKAKGGMVTLEATSLPGSDEIIAFVSDPDGYQIELIQRSTRKNNKLDIS